MLITKSCHAREESRYFYVTDYPDTSVTLKGIGCETNVIRFQEFSESIKGEAFVYYLKQIIERFNVESFHQFICIDIIDVTIYTGVRPITKLAVCH